MHIQIIFIFVAELLIKIIFNQFNQLGVVLSVRLSDE